MKLQGKKLSTMNVQVVVIPRDGGDIVFKAAAVLDTKDFDLLCPEPTPPNVLKRGETVPVPDINNPKYKEEMTKRNKLYTHYLLLKSLQATPDLEWETVDMTKPETWENVDKEMEDAGLNTMERAHIIQAVMRANSLDMNYIEEARKRFFSSAQPSLPPQ